MPSTLKNTKVKLSYWLDNHLHSVEIRVTSACVIDQQEWKSNSSYSLLDL
ncbi:hypothetical protein [Hyunsoonleella pacifica]|nr:hypothetical protein [Hyunsoonleella pacifica]